ncbi:hypothetical protein L5515_009444 [Caenorhabditis briggsae]|uniref:CUB-like domain-containing protein n=1 Tax=Caenorhabditis briggsae TaxID=6238 RepID=A0AAE9FBM9_CAEBR|nr:hypothetical protein L5515_009444 [Caenorhabditis briggsae]
MLKLLFLVFISWVQLIGAVVPDCKSGTIIFDPPLDRSTVTWYPRNFTNNAPLYPNNYNCTYQINVPQGWFAEIQLTVSSTTVQVIDQMGRVETTSSSNSEFFYFIANGGKLKLSTGVTSANFGFSVLWKQYDNPTYAHKYDVSKSEAVPFSYFLYGNKPIVVEAETRVSATIVPVNRYKTQYLRGIIYLDGPNFTSPCLGTGLQLLNGNTQFVSKGNFLTVLILGNSGSNPLLLFNDFYNMNGIKRFEAIQCDAICSEMKIDASKGRSVFQVDNGESQYILQKMTGFGKLDVYAGNLTPEKRNLIASYDLTADNHLSLPQVFKGYFTTFVMESGNCTISQTNSDAYSLNIDYGRKGIITSAEYGTSWNSQDVVTKMYAPGNAKFQYSIKSVDLKTWDSLEVVGRNDQQVTFRQKYNSTNYPRLNQNVQFYASEMDVIFDSISRNTGFLMQYSVEKSAVCQSFWTIFVAVLVFF